MKIVRGEEPIRVERPIFLIYMALAFEPALITYRIYWLEAQADGLVWLRGIEQCHCYPYPDLRADCGALLLAFAQYAERRGLLDLLERRHRERSDGSWYTSTTTL